MTPAERLQAAIEKLEHQKALSTTGPWEAYTVPGTRKEAEYVAIGIGDSEARVVRFEGGYFDADLIVTLHRTIDAQLAILRAALKARTLALYSPMTDPALALADAILGGDQ